MSKLPKGWVNTKLGVICSNPQYGWTTPSCKEGKVKLIRTTDISCGKINWDDIPYCLRIPENIDKYKVDENDILISRAGSVGISYRMRKIEFDSVFASYLIRIKPIKIVLPKYIEYFLKSSLYWSQISDMSAGIAVPNINATKLSQLSIPLAPIDEQKRIVKKLEKLLNRVNSCDARLEKIPLILKRFRQSVLSAACSGKLTADWREANKDINPASFFLKSINNSYKEVRADINPNGCEKWSKISIRDFFESFGGGTPSREKPHFWNGDIPWVSSGDVKTDYLVSGSEFISQDGLENSSAKMCPIDSVIVVVRSGILKHTLPVSIVKRSLAINQDIKCFNSKSKELNLWLFYYLKAVQSEILSKNREGTTVQSVKYDTLKNLEIWIPPIEEQKEIVKRVNALFKIADDIEARYNKAKAYTDKLTQSILSKAFKGELVPQDPNDEPASVLLEKIKKEKESQVASKPSKRKKVDKLEKNK